MLPSEPGQPNLRSVLASQPAHARAAVARLGAGQAVSTVAGLGTAELTLIASPDGRIADLAGQLAAAIDLLQTPEDTAEPARTETCPAPPQGMPVRVRHFAANGSVFVNDTYLIKGVAGAIIWKLLREHLRSGRIEFSNRELRLDRTLGLPEVADNLEARLLLLQRRLQESNTGIRLEKAGRGRLRLCLDKPVVLDAVP